MKYEPIVPHPNHHRRDLASRISRIGLIALQVVLFGLAGTASTGRAEDLGADDQGAQVLTRGPIHEAFASIISYHPEPGVIVDKTPPAAIEEVPPDVRPAGDNIAWIPGYWGWDDERGDYLWISGTWRALPPGRQWTTGYWSTTGQGYQWISGYWADSTLREINYLPKPPVAVEEGPNVEAPSRDHAWTPGFWMWNQGRYAWSPGYWAEGRPDWDWIPAHYVWTPRGYIFVDGYWDYSFDRRGVLYAPVYLNSGYYSKPGYSYSPVIAIGLVALMEHLFLRPNYQHYYFGDYYDRTYRDRGYYSPYDYQSSRYGYDPVYAYRRWTNRQDQDWEKNHVTSYEYRRDHPSARPPRTWAEQKRLRLDAAESGQRQFLIATPIDQMAKQEDRPLRIQELLPDEKRQINLLSREVRRTREQRRLLEAVGENAASGKADGEIKPTKGRLPLSPIVGKQSGKIRPKPAPPKRQPPMVGPEIQKSDRQTDARKPRSGAKRDLEPSRSRARQEPKTPERKEAAPRAKKETTAPVRETSPQIKSRQPEKRNRVETPQTETRPRPQPKATEPDRRTQSKSGQTSKPPAVKPARNTRLEGAVKQAQDSGTSSSGKKSNPDTKDSGSPSRKIKRRNINHH